MINSKVWERVSDNHTLSKRAYIMLLTFWVACGMLFSAVCASVSMTWQIGLVASIGLFTVTHAIMARYM